MKKLVRENIFILNEGKFTRSYDEPMTPEKIKALVESILKKYKRDHEFRGAPLISSMSNWLQLNNFGSYQFNKWIKAIVDNTFKYKNGIWYRINKQLSSDELTDIVMNYWHDKFNKQQ